ncbi:O-antigen ligase family protein [Halosegnis rubeus]|uniref:O-antigen ligase-related domain-containing protein n=1 Tax=Halosegnis rubeus TaxID=2212850 RepID=A0A5N5UGX5_9EURY|nr:O-antigen ligase family protein [Halosegnis rubeus]KAB7517975.1 hypothetical protein DMP03_01000 [Halosegnis rubeus]
MKIDTPRSNQIKGLKILDFIYLLLPIILVFSVEVPIPVSGLSYVSINSEDLAIAVLVAITAGYTLLERSYKIDILTPQVACALLASTLWIITSVTVAALRTQGSILGSTLWMLKWIEDIMLFFVLSKTITKNRAKIALHSLIFAGTLLGLIVLVLGVSGAYRPRIFFGNPNTLSAFLLFPTGIWISKAANVGAFRAAGSVTLAAALSIAIAVTGSRSGLLGLFVVVLVSIFLNRNKLGFRDWMGIATTSVGAIFAGFIIADKTTVQRLTGWVEYESGTLSLTNTVAARSFQIRLELIQKAIRLFREYPIFGHGWYASPTRVGPLDVHYTTLLAEIGFIGLCLFVWMYSTFLRVWIRALVAGGSTVAFGATAWYCGLLTQSIGGNFPRTPHLMFITILLLVCVAGDTIGKATN